MLNNTIFFLESYTGLPIRIKIIIIIIYLSVKNTVHFTHLIIYYCFFSIFLILNLYLQFKILILIIMLTRQKNQVACRSLSTDYPI